MAWFYEGVDVADSRLRARLHLHADETLASRFWNLEPTKNALPQIWNRPQTGVPSDGALEIRDGGFFLCGRQTHRQRVC